MIDKAPTTLLEVLAKKVIRRHFNAQSPAVCRTYRNAISRFWLYLDREPTTADMKEQVYRGFRKWLADCGTYKKSTQTSTLQRLRTIWRAAFNAGLTTSNAPSPYWHAGGLEQLPPRPPKAPPLVLLPAESSGPRKPPATPRAFVTVYALERGIADGSCRQLHFRLNAFEKHLGRPAEFADFNDAELNLHLAQRLQAGLDPETVKDDRTGLLTLWRAMDEHYLVELPPRRIRKVKVPRKPVRTWNMEQLRTLLKTADGLQGFFKFHPEIRRAHFWRAFILVKYSSGIRLGDMMAMRWDQISPDGMLTVVMQKTGDMVTTKLPPEVVAAMAPLRKRETPEVFGGILGRKYLMDNFKRLVHTAGLPAGTSKWLRRASATQIEIVSPGGAKAFLGHRTHGLADRNYIDQTIVQREKPTPPRIEGPQ